jgi:PIN domain nuclease of toxin-antitoxin system
VSEEPGRCILDASAVLAYLHREPGGDTVALFLDSGLISAVNLSEVAARIVGLKA